MKKQEKLRNHLLKILLAITFIPVTICLIYFMRFRYIELRNSSTIELQRLCSNEAQNLDIKISEMDTIALNIINSEETQKNFYNLYHQENLSPYQKTQIKENLQESLFIIKGVDEDIRQINIFDTSGNSFGVGDYFGQLKEEQIDQNRIEQTISNSGHLTFHTPSKDISYSIYDKLTEGTYHFTISRLGYSKYYIPMTIVDVVRNGNDIFGNIQSPLNKYNISFSIYSPEGLLLFPYSDSETKSFNYFNVTDETESVVHNDIKDQDEYCYRAVADYSKLVVYASISKTEFMEPIYRIIKILPVLLIIIFAICYILSRIISTTISSPLSKIYNFLSNESNNKDFKQIEMEQSNVIEIETLKDSINNSIATKQENTRKLLLLKEHELQAQMLALQAQMNPHFLYNSLNTISAMAQNGNIEPIEEMCSEITSILRYISSNKEKFSTIEIELEHCDSFLHCQKLRFRENFNYIIEIEDNMLAIEIPKLCIQLLVENSVKYVSHTEPPWDVTITGNIIDNKWKISIEDNGPGFSEDAKIKVKEQILQIKENGILPNLEIDGMGLINVFMRLYLIYKENFIFEIENGINNGSRVTIGGEWDEKNQTI